MMFSVIVPAYNSENTIDRCLMSVKLQSFTDFEVIIVDDGSTDRTQEICKSFEACDSRFVYFYKENGGVSSARNFGLSKARGIYVTFLDSDDVYHDNYLASFLGLIKKYPEKQNYWCGYQYITNREEQKGRIVVAENAGREYISNRTMILTLLETEMVAPLWNKVYVRDVLVQNKINMPLDLSLGEDYLFNLMYLDCGGNPEILILNEANYDYYSFSEESLNKKYRRDLWKIYNQLLEALWLYLKKWQVPYTQRVKFYNNAFYMYDHVLRNTFHKKNTDSILRKVSYNNQILKTKRFQKACQYSDVKVNKIYKRLYAFKNYGLLWLADQLLKVKKYRRCHE